MNSHLHTADDPHAALDHLAGCFFGPGLAAEAIEIPRDEVPTPFDRLLVHDEHMTDRLKTFHGAPIALEVLATRPHGDRHARKIRLTVAGSDHVVEVGVARIDLRYTPDRVRAEILERETPLGDILIRHDVLRRIEPKWFFRFDPPAAPGRAVESTTRSGAPPRRGAEDGPRDRPETDGARLASAFDRPIDGPIYGRVGVIHCGGVPAIELFEAVSAEKATNSP
ncbi:MAG: hypothetical protein ACE5E1_08100 [Phycisphaerae bacterium]